MLVFNKEKFKENAPTGIKRQLVDQLDDLEGKKVVFDGKYGRDGYIKKYFHNGQEYHLYPVYKSWCIEKKNQYCRYCGHCVGQTDDWGICEIKNEEVSKTSVRNACTDFEFCEIDAFYYTRSDNPDDAVYKPRSQKTPRTKQCDGQISLF